MMQQILTSKTQKIKALVAALEDVDIEEAMETAVAAGAAQHQQLPKTKLKKKTKKRKRKKTKLTKTKQQKDSETYSKLIGPSRAFFIFTSYFL